MQPSEFTALTRSLVGLPISRPWRGHGSCLVVELGPLERSYPKSGRPRANASIMIQWSWRVERSRAIEFGSWSGEKKMNNGIARLQGLVVEDISVVGRLTEISVQLSGGRWLHSFMTAEGQPQWSVFLQDRSWLTVRRGHIVKERGDAVRHGGA